MVEAIVLLTTGVLIGRLWAWLKAATQVAECPQCAIEDEGRRTSFAISAQARMAEQQMRETAAQYGRPEESRAYDESVHRPSSRYGGSDGY